MSSKRADILPFPFLFSSISVLLIQLVYIYTKWRKKCTNIFRIGEMIHDPYLGVH